MHVEGVQVGSNIFLIGVFAEAASESVLERLQLVRQRNESAEECSNTALSKLLYSIACD